MSKNAKRRSNFFGTKTVFKLNFAIITLLPITLGFCSPQESFAQSSEYKKYMQAQETYCIQMASKECDKQKVRYYQYFKSFPWITS